MAPLARSMILGAAVAALASPLGADETSFPELLDPGLPGTPKLGAPMLVKGGAAPVLTEKHGLAAPAVWDWDGDGRQDLLVGEFETIAGEGPMGAAGSTVRVHLNTGTDSAPRFAAEFEWARSVDGTIMEVPQWCCIGFTPQFVDLDADGRLDMITGQYHPGEVTWFRGAPDGFLAGVKLRQQGDPAANGQPMFGNYDGEPGDIGTFTYWAYSSASFGDLDDDGDYDLIVGGVGGLRISENVGSRERPSFAARELLLTVQGEPLRILHRDDEDELFAGGEQPPPDGDGKSSPLVVDWDDDGILDLLVTGSYRHPASQAVTFFRGARTPAGHRFHPGVDLLPAADGAKALPGSGPRVFVADWNRDGVKDLIIGASVATVKGGVFSDELSWQWEDLTGIESAGKDPGRYPPRERPTEDSPDFAVARQSMDEEAYLEFVEMNQQYWDDTVGRLYEEGKAHWLTMRHQGRIYVLLGSRREEAPGAESALRQAGTDAPAPQASDADPAPPPVTVELLGPDTLRVGETGHLAVRFDMRPGWFIYAPTGRNAPHGVTETAIGFALPEGVAETGTAMPPLHQFKGLFDIYEGQDRRWRQPISAAAAGRFEVRSTVTYQTCKDDFCLPPRTQALRTTVAVAAGPG